MVCSDSSPPFTSTICRKIISKLFARKSACSLRKTFCSARAAISIRPICASLSSATAPKSNRKPRSSAKSASTTRRERNLRSSAVQSLNRRWQNFLALALFFCAAILFCFAAANAASKKQLPARPFDLNTATLKQLEGLPGVGPVTAHAILNFREKNGPFKSVNDLLVIPRISKKKLDKIRPYVFVKPPSAAKSPAAPAKNTAPPKTQTVRLSPELQLP